MGFLVGWFCCGKLTSEKKKRFYVVVNISVDHLKMKSWSMEAETSPKEYIPVYVNDW